MCFAFWGFFFLNLEWFFIKIHLYFLMHLMDLFVKNVHVLSLWILISNCKSYHVTPFIQDWKFIQHKWAYMLLLINGITSLFLGVVKHNETFVHLNGIVDVQVDGTIVLYLKGSPFSLYVFVKIKYIT